MAIWKEQAPPKEVPTTPELTPRKDAPIDLATALNPPRRAPDRDVKESLIAAGITIEGKIEGSGHVRIAGNFNGDVQVQGDLSIEPGAKLTGGVRASTVVIGGELQGNITSAARVELLASGVLTGDLKAGSLTVAAGSRMRGQVEFGWDEKSPAKSGVRLESGSAA